ncbi:uncharacterized protein BCR38DRAFT_408381 [Pseudomassariella vexata]|uniref:Uncharacterized protein n=1 Tax=Pseudomassariella vexata TaxID=1141098 RepID=A0A1Y2E507_9PEZI|nr:uncharacterized protein BCR38DRAFT_408381 [Pseudomassariella vexata]ORY66444.1 hypothetical protein BCR38DRAFT_408381 [Pseudomassariella vexata]
MAQYNGPPVSKPEHLGPSRFQQEAPRESDSNHRYFLSLAHPPCGTLGGGGVHVYRPIQSSQVNVIRNKSWSIEKTQNLERISVQNREGITTVQPSSFIEPPIAGAGFLCTYLARPDEGMASNSCPKSSPRLSPGIRVANTAPTTAAHRKSPRRQM